ncbi:MAG: Gfo/Idh/MocA family oxidoreductase, partial [Gemmataceae bacterium]
DYPYAYVRWTEQRNMESFLELVRAGRVTPSKLVTHRFPVAEALKAYELLEKGAEPYLGILLEYPAKDGQKPSRAVEVRSLQQKGRTGIGFVGAGNFAKGVLLPALKKSPGIDLICICTATGMSASETAKKFGFGVATTDYESLLTDERINTVFIATRHESHARLACAALSRGKHVFVEKPLCVKPAQIDDYRKAIEKAGPNTCLMVGFNRRFSPHALSIQKAFSDRHSPMVVNYRVNAGMIPKETWVQDSREGGGRIIGEVCHFVDFCEFLTGSEVVQVAAASIQCQDSRITPEDSTVVTLRYADGSLATIQYVAVGSPDLPKERVEVYADGAVAVLEDFVETRFFGRPEKRIRTRQDKGFTGEVNAFLGAIQNGGAWP